MKKLIFLLFLTPILHSLPVDAQFKSSGKQAEMVNIKFISQDETLNIAKIIGNLTSDQSERIYLANLQINRKILGRPEAKNVVDINDPLFLKYRKEKEIVYKKIMNPVQYQIYESSVKKNDSKLANTNVKIFGDREEGRNTDNRTLTSK